MAGKNRLLAKILGSSDIGHVTPDSDSLSVASTKNLTNTAGITVVTTVNDLPNTAPTGKKALVTSNNTVYLFNGGWYKIVTINNFNPQWITQPSATYDLAINSTPTVITVVATDSDDVPIKYIATTDSDFNAIATVSHDSDKHNVFTIIPIDSENGAATGGTGTITFKATDGVNLVQQVSTFSLSFGADWSATPTESILYSSDIQAYDFFGYSVSMSSGGEYAIVGAYYEESNANDAGAAYIFNRSGSTWSQQAKIQHSDPQADDWFGQSVSISSDGSYAIVGVRHEDTGASNAGAAYIFVRSGTSWSQQAKIQASDASTTANAQFGYSVSISGDGSYAIVGSHRWNGSTWAGAAYIYVRSGTSWTQQQQIQASDAQSSDLFGSSVSMNSDGTYVIVGAFAEATGGSNAGAAYVFTRSGSTWSQQAKIQASDAGASDQFGYSVSINSDGTYAAVGAKTQTGFDYGAGYIFTRSGSTWSQQAKIVSSDIQSNDNFGISISLNSDASHVIAGAWGDDTAAGADQAGAAYIFSRNGTSWTQARKIQASDIQPGDEFGWSVSMSGDGKYVIAGAPKEDTGGNPNSGAAYIYESG